MPTVARQPTPLQLTLEQVSASTVIPQALAAQSQVNVYENALGDLVMEIKAYMAEDHLTGEWVEREVGFSHCWDHWASWWQHTKAVHFPTLARWLRRPPRKVTECYEEHRRVRIHHDRYAALPDAPIYPIEFGKPIIIERWGKVSDQVTSTHHRAYHDPPKG